MVVESLLSLLDSECVVCLQSLVRFCCIPSFFFTFWSFEMFHDGRIMWEVCEGCVCFLC